MNPILSISLSVIHLITTDDPTCSAVKSVNSTGKAMSPPPLVLAPHIADGSHAVKEAPLCTIYSVGHLYPFVPIVI